MTHLQKTTAGSAGPHEWADGQVIEVDHELARELLLTPDADFVETDEDGEPLTGDDLLVPEPDEDNVFAEIHAPAGLLLDHSGVDPQGALRRQPHIEQVPDRPTTADVLKGRRTRKRNGQLVSVAEKDARAGSATSLLLGRENEDGTVALPTTTNEVNPSAPVATDDTAGEAGAAALRLQAEKSGDGTAEPGDEELAAAEGVGGFEHA